MPNSHANQLLLDRVSLKAPNSAHDLLQEISFEVPAGTCVGIVGTSGAGKTSLLKVINRLLEVSQGRILFEGEDIHHIPVIALRRKITLLPQESKLLGMKVRETLAYPLTIRNMDRSIIEQRLQYWIEQLHLPSDWLDRTEVQLSVGQRQLVAIGRALIIQPQVLLLDEPTSALDAGRGEFLIQLLRELAVRSSVTILMVNHQLEFVEQFASQVLHLRQGQLIQNRPAHQVNWSVLRQTLIDENAAIAEEWA